MSNRDVLILKGDEIDAVLKGREQEIIATVEAAYKVHSAGDTSLPNSSFLHFPNNERSRIIALPAHLGREFDVAGVKWVSSFPGNLDEGLNRASGRNNHELRADGPGRSHHGRLAHKCQTHRR